MGRIKDYLYDKAEQIEALTGYPFDAVFAALMNDPLSMELPPRLLARRVAVALGGDVPPRRRLTLARR